MSAYLLDRLEYNERSPLQRLRRWMREKEQANPLLYFTILVFACDAVLVTALFV